MQRVRLTRRHFSLHVWPGLMLSLLPDQFSFARRLIEQNAMYITLERSGGFTGVPLTITVDTATLPPDKVAQLRHLIETADFFHVSAPSRQAQPDRFEYKITVQDDDRTHTITFGEAAIPEPLKPLMQWIMESARSH